MGQFLEAFHVELNVCVEFWFVLGQSWPNGWRVGLEIQRLWVQISGPAGIGGTKPPTSPGHCSMGKKAVFYFHLNINWLVIHMYT